MEKSKLTLALVVSFSAIMALTACDDVTAKDGVVLSYTDNEGTRVDYTASELLGTYEQGSSAASTNFNKVKEVLIRKYYEEGEPATLEQLKTSAQNSVNSIKKQAQSNADSNGTSYATELESLLDSNGVDNVSELFEAKLYEEEQKDFERSYKDADAVEAMKTGVDADGNAYFPFDSEYGRGSNGYLIEKVPYHVSHFLVKFSSSSHSESCQFTITKDESLKISQAVKLFAGVDQNSEDGTGESKIERQTFGQICKQHSDDSAENYGNLGLMESGYVNEFRLGVYAYDALYNNKHNEESPNSYACKTTGEADPAGNNENRSVRDHVLPSEDDTYGSETGTYEKKTRDYFENLGIGTIPYGAAVALGYDSVASDPNKEYSVNDGDATYYARNILFNKYFNNRSIAVIVPEKISFNDLYEEYKDGTLDTTEAAAEAYVATEEENFTVNNGWYRGTYDSTYASLPGFSVDTSDILPITSTTGDSENVLTNDRGQIILAVKASNSSGNAYEGIHFIVVNRSALDAYVAYDSDPEVGESCYETYDTVEEAKADGYTEESSDLTSLSEYFTVNYPKYSDDKTEFQNPDEYPSYKKSSDSKAQPKSTFVNTVYTSDANYQDTADKISDAIKGYNSSEDTYIFQKLINTQSLKFNANTVLGAKFSELIKDYISETRKKNYEDEIKSLDDAWSTYAEVLERQNEEREIGDGKQRLISEYVALTYNTDDAKNGENMYDVGGIGYDGKK